MPQGTLDERQLDVITELVSDCMRFFEFLNELIDLGQPVHRRPLHRNRISIEIGQRPFSGASLSPKCVAATGCDTG